MQAQLGKLSHGTERDRRQVRQTSVRCLAMAMIWWGG